MTDPLQNATLTKTKNRGIVQNKGNFIRCDAKYSDGSYLETKWFEERYGDDCKDWRDCFNGKFSEFNNGTMLYLIKKSIHP